MPIPEEFKGKEKDLMVYYVDENNKVHDYDVTPEGNYAVYTTDHFSIYTLAVKDENDNSTDSGAGNSTGINKGDKDETPKTGVESSIGYILALAVVSGAGIVILKKKL